jgi:hypothetical protein
MRMPDVFYLALECSLFSWCFFSINYIHYSLFLHLHLLIYAVLGVAVRELSSSIA